MMQDEPFQSNIVQLPVEPHATLVRHERVHALSVGVVTTAPRGHVPA